MRPTDLGLIAIVLAACCISCVHGPSQHHLSQSSLPDKTLTPGDVLDVTTADICSPGYTIKVREVPAAIKRAVYSAYRKKPIQRICCKIDHLIPLELGGSNRIRNLWPQEYGGAWNAHDKDRLEARLHRLVCSGRLDLSVAQRAIADDWIAAYRMYEPGALSGSGPSNR